MPHHDPDQVPTESDAPDGGVSRRLVLKGAAGAGLAAAAVGVAVEAASPADASSHVSASSGPIVAHVRNARTGEIDVFTGDRQVTVHDRALAARLVAIAR